MQVYNMNTQVLRVVDLHWTIWDEMKWGEVKWSVVPVIKPSNQPKDQFIHWNRPMIYTVAPSFLHPALQVRTREAACQNQQEPTIIMSFYCTFNTQFCPTFNLHIDV